MSRTSGSCSMSALPQVEQAAGSVRETVMAPHVGAVPHGDAVAPPQLARDAPVADVAHPVGVGVLPALGIEADLALLPRREPLLGQGFHFHEPLVGEVRFDHRVAAVAVADLVGVRLLPDEQPRGGEVLHDLRPRLRDGEPAVGLGHVLVELPVRGEDVDHGESVAPADLVVHAVVGRSHLHRAGAEGPVDAVVGDDRDRPAREREADHLPDKVRVALVLGVHGHGRVAEHGLGPGGRDRGSSPSRRPGGRSSSTSSPVSPRAPPRHRRWPCGRKCTS